MKRKIVFCGDVHGQFNALYKLDEELEPSYIIQCGDLGIFKPEEMKDLDWQSKRHNGDNRSILLWVPGNHDNHDYIDGLGKPEKRLIFLPDANENLGIVKKYSSYHFADNARTAGLFISGAESTDKHRRVEGQTWWRNEIMTAKEAEEAYNSITKRFKKGDIDFIATHTAPSFVLEELGFKNTAKFNDPTCTFLQAIWEHLEPKLWIHGHFHTYNDFTYKGKTRVISLDMCDHQTGEYDEGFYHILELDY